jgi:hypothetical protein
VIHVQLHLPASMWWAVCALAAYRLTRLVTTDEVLHRFRQWVARRSTTAGYWVTCPWCLGFWMCVLLGAAVLLAPTPTAYACVVLSWSAIVGVISERTP